MTTVEESPILIPSEDEEDDDDIVVVKEEKIQITIDETEDADQDGEVIFVAHTSAPSPSQWGRTEAASSHVHIISEKETSAAAAAIADRSGDVGMAASPGLSAIAGVSTPMSPAPCSTDLSSISDLVASPETKPPLHRNLSLTSAVEFSLSLDDEDQSPLDLSKNSGADGKTGSSVDLSVLRPHQDTNQYVTNSKTGTSVDLTVLRPHQVAGRYVTDVDSSTFDDSSDGSIGFDRMGAASASASVLMTGSSQGGLHTDVTSVSLLATPFSMPSSSQTVMNSGCPQLGITDTSNNSTELDQREETTALQAATLLMNFAAASTSSQMAGGSNHPVATSGSSGAVNPLVYSSGGCVHKGVKLSAVASTSTDTSTQLLVDFLMQDDTLSQVLAPVTTCVSGVSPSPNHSVSHRVSQMAPTVVPAHSSVPSGQSAVIPTKPLFINATKPEDPSVGAKSFSVPGMRLLVSSQTIGFQQQTGCNTGNRVNVSSPLNFAQVLAQMFDHQAVASSAGPSGAASSMMVSSSSLSAASSLITATTASSSLPSTLPSSSSSSLRMLYTAPSFDHMNPATGAPQGTLPFPAPLSTKRTSANSLSALDNSSLPPRKRVRTLIDSNANSFSGTSAPPLISHTGKSASFPCNPVSDNSTSIDQGSSAFSSHSSSLGVDANSLTHTAPGGTVHKGVCDATASTSTSLALPRGEDGGACERCQNSIIGTQLSRCTQGHRACGLCLEEQVKLVLTGRQKGSLKCITSKCSSYYPMSELKHSLPNMVVEILEDKLDRDYVEYISDMMLSNATSNTTAASTTTTTTTTTSTSNTPSPSTSKCTAEVQTSDNSDIDDNNTDITDDVMDDNDIDNDADESGDDSDDSTSSSSISSSTSDVTVKCQIAAATRLNTFVQAATGTVYSASGCVHKGGQKLLPASSSSSLSSLASDDAMVQSASPSVDLGDDDNDNISDDDDAFGDLTDDYDDVMVRGGGRGVRCGSKEGMPSRYDSRDERQKDLPENWVKMDNSTTLLAVPLKPDSEEYIEVAIRFHTTMTFPQADIAKILRIQNPIMWKYYSLKRLEMVQENDGLSVEEKLLFHGTKCSVIDAICRKGFDWRVCGKHGTAYGHGCYFALDSIYSHNYTDRTTDVGQASVILRSISGGSQLQSEGLSSSSHLAPASVNLSSLNPQPSGSSGSGLHHVGKYHHVALVGSERWQGRHLPSSSAQQFGVSAPGPTPSGSSGVTDVSNGVGSSGTLLQSHLWSRRQFLRKILARINPVMYQPSGASSGQPIQGMSAHPPPSYPPKPSQQPLVPKSIVPKQTYPPTTPVLGGGVPQPSLQNLRSVSGVQLRQHPSGPPVSGPNTNAKPVSLMVGPYGPHRQGDRLGVGPGPPVSQPASSQSLQQPGIAQQSAGPSSGLVPSFTPSLPGGGVMVGGQGSGLGGPVPGPSSGFALGPMQSAHTNSLLFLSRQPPIAPPHVFSHIAHSHSNPRAHSHLPPWVRLPTGPPHAHAIPEPGKYCAGTRYMFLAKVLVGRSTGGCSGFRRPPPLDPNEPFGKCYDSCVDNIFDPKIFVVFDSNQAYPEYIIEYKFVE